MKTSIFLIGLILFSGIAAAQSTTKIDVELKKTEPVPLQTSEYADIWLEVTNNGDTAAENVNVTFLETYPFSTDPDEKTSWDLGRLEAGEEYQIHMQAKIDENAVQGSNTLKFRTISGNGPAITKELDVEIRSDNNILAVSNISLAETVRPGTQERMTVTLENMADGQLKNIEFTVETDSEDLPIATADTATKNIQSLAAGETTQISYDLRIDESAENGVYKIPLVTKYENEAGTNFTRRTRTGIVIGGKPQLEVGINENNLPTPASQETFTLRIVNRGQGSANFVNLELKDAENYEILSPETVYIGDMDPDDFQTAEFRIYIEDDAQNLNMPLELSYSDMEGEQTQTETLTPKLYTGSELRRFGEEQSVPWIPVAAVAIVAIAGFLYWRRRRKK